MTHLEDSDFLETCYGAASTSVRQHLAECELCAQRQTAFAAKLEAARDESRRVVDSKPDSFWQRQQIAIERRIASGEKSERHHGVRQLAAAAVLLVIAGGAWFGRTLTSDRHTATPQRAVTTTAAASVKPETTDTATDTLSTDPWDADELKGYHSMVQWETWETTETSKGRS